MLKKLEVAMLVMKTCRILRDGLVFESEGAFSLLYY
jgi:hypothetical protein